MIHRHYQDHGTIREDHWLNLYDSFATYVIDRFGPDDPHFGPDTHAHIADVMSPRLKSKLQGGLYP